MSPFRRPAPDSGSRLPIAAGGRCVIAAVGPSGVGKTTTIAKLAARAKLEGRTVTLVTSDTFRVGGVEQLQRYAELLDARCEVLRAPSDMAGAVARCRTDLLLVDTSGRPPELDSPEHTLRATAFAELNEGRGFGRRVLLCMPASTRAVDATRIVKTFSAADPTELAITKLDETDRPSGLIHALVASKLPITIICTGQRVPEDFEPATKDRIVEFLLHNSARSHPT